MKQLTQEVKDKALNKWSFRAKTRKEAEEWLNGTCFSRCSFCRWFEYDGWGCKCPLHDGGDICCKELSTIDDMTVLYYDDYELKSNVKLKDFNAACEAMQNRIRSLKVG